MNSISPIYKLLVIPLLSMVLLTLVVGGTAFELTHAWEDAAREVTQSLTQSIALNNVRWKLREIQETLDVDPSKARTLWADLKKKVDKLPEPAIKPGVCGGLRAFFHNEESIHRINFFIQESLFNIDLEPVQERLKDLQEHTRFVTAGVTICMLVLGLILMMVTTWDISKLFKALEASRDLNISLQEQERQRIAQDLHDSVIQEMIDLKRSYDPSKVDHMIETMRRICHNLKPQIIEDLGFVASLEFLADELRECGKRKVELSVDLEGIVSLPKQYELPLFRVVQELFNNIRRHAQASQVRLTLVYQPEESPLLRLYVQDNGCGFDPANVKGGLGLTGIQERIQHLGGRIKMESTAEKGSLFQFFVPIEM